MYYVLHQPYVINCEFISCHADDDGGGLSVIFSSAIDNQLACIGCSFVACTVPNDMTLSRTPSAGGTIEWKNLNVITYSSILFSSNEGTFGGSYGTNSIPPAHSYLLSFCFFNKNTGSCGNDVYFSPH